MADSIELFSSFHKNPILATTHLRNSTQKASAYLGFSISSSKRNLGGLRCRAIDAKSVDGEMFSLTSSSKSDVDYLGESTKGDLNVKREHLEAFGELGNRKKCKFYLFFCFNCLSNLLEYIIYLLQPLET